MSERESVVVTTSRVQAWVAGLLILAAAALVSIDVTTRNLFGWSIVERFELSIHAFATSVTLGMAFALTTKAHIRIEVIGCSFSFEEALMAEGIALRHIERGCNVPMCRTSLAPAGLFAGPLVVSMRPLKAADAIRAVEITARFPAVRGAPIHLGVSELIGIGDLSRPDYSDAVPVGADELPVFWVSGGDASAVIAAARPAFAITHAPGSMLVTDLINSRLAAREGTATARCRTIERMVS